MPYPVNALRTPPLVHCAHLPLPEFGEGIEGMGLYFKNLADKALK
jgi:hypothetical protein